MAELEGKKVAVLATHGVERSELLEPMRALREAGATVHLIAPHGGTVRTWSNKNWADEVPVDRTLADVHVDEYDALILPGGVLNPDALRIVPDAVAFVRAFFDAGKPMGAICHGPWLLVEADVVRGRRATSWPSLRTDLTNAGGRWEDAEVVVDRGLITSRKPADLPAFNRRLIEAIARLGSQGARPEAR